MICDNCINDINDSQTACNDDDDDNVCLYRLQKKRYKPPPLQTSQKCRRAEIY